MVNVGLVTGPETPSAWQAPRTNVVLPAPISPRTSTMSPGASRAARSAAAASVPAGLELLIGRAHAQAGPGQHQREAGEEHQAQVGARVRKRVGRGRRRAGRGCSGARRARARRTAVEPRVLRETTVVAVALGSAVRRAAAARRARARTRAGAAAGERVGVLIVARAPSAL